MHKRKPKVLLVLVFAITLLSYSANIAFADPTGSGSYTASSAISYANTWAMDYNTNVYQTVPNDCTNFVSQCLRAGGWPLANTSYAKSNIYAWYYKSSQSNNSWTWNAAQNLWQFIVTNSNPSRGWDIGIVYPGTTSVAYPSTVVYGDVFFYDWEDDGVMGHATIYVANGTDVGTSQYTGSYYTGALIDGHSSARLKAIWSLSYYNLARDTTYIYPVHLNSSF